jgi:hypothetical protein
MDISQAIGHRWQVENPEVGGVVVITSCVRRLTSLGELLLPSPHDLGQGLLHEGVLGLGTLGGPVGAGGAPQSLPRVLTEIVLADLLP